MKNIHPVLFPRFVMVTSVETLEGWISNKPENENFSSHMCLQPLGFLCWGNIFGNQAIACGVFMAIICNMYGVLTEDLLWLDYCTFVCVCSLCLSHN